MILRFERTTIHVRLGKDLDPPFNDVHNLQDPAETHAWSPAPGVLVARLAISELIRKTQKRVSVKSRKPRQFVVPLARQPSLLAMLAPPPPPIVVDFDVALRGRYRVRRSGADTEDGVHIELIQRHAALAHQRAFFPILFGGCFIR